MIEKLTVQQREALIVYADLYEECILNATASVTDILHKKTTGGGGVDK